VLNGYLDHLDRAEPPVPAQGRLLAALGPRKLELARDRCAGAILLLVTPAYTTIVTRIGQYRQADADHIMLHVLNDGGQPGPMEVARELAGNLLAGRPSAAP
jgi:hypothetical protein